MSVGRVCAAAHLPVTIYHLPLSTDIIKKIKIAVARQNVRSRDGSFD